MRKTEKMRESQITKIKKPSETVKDTSIKRIMMMKMQLMLRMLMI